MMSEELFSNESIKAFNLLLKERLRQQTHEGYTPAHDDEHTEGQLALLAAAYALSSRGHSIRESGILQMVVSLVRAEGWSFKPAAPIRDLTRAGALILAELERRLRNQDPVSRAIAEGLLQENQRGWAEAFSNRDPAGFRGYVERTER